MYLLRYFLAIVFLCLIACKQGSLESQKGATASYDDLIRLFRDWRAFEQPPLLDGAPDYTREGFQKREPAFRELQARLNQMDTSGWTITERIDWTLIWAEMNGYDFNQRILRPWERDPAFYKTVWMERSDVPAHEGPTHHRLAEIWTYRFPLSATDRDTLFHILKAIPSLQKQARTNLTGNARDLWIAGIRDIRTQAADLELIQTLPGVAKDTGLQSTITQAIISTRSFADWLEKESPAKNGASGIGKEAYTWYQQQVHLVPMTWDDEVQLLKRELARAWASLKLEEHRNRHLPPLQEASGEVAYKELAESAAKGLLRFLDTADVMTMEPYFEPALRAHLGAFVPKERRHFFWIAAHFDPRPLYSHFYHWFELARMDVNPHPSPVRRTPLLYNIFDSRNEGLATAAEEIFMQAGLYDQQPRVREIVYIMLAQRAARGLGSLYAHANEMTMEEAGGIHTDYTPRGWMKTEKELRIFEQQLYLRQPGYGTSYVTGKYLIDETMAEYARLQETKSLPYQNKQFLDTINAIGCIPVSLVYWQLTGDDRLVPKKKSQSQ